MENCYRPSPVESTSLKIPEPHAPVIIAGIGSEILTDDGIALRLVRDLSVHLGKKNIDYALLSVGGLDLMDITNGYRTTIILDAVISDGGLPGEVCILRPDDAWKTLHVDNGHDFRFAHIISLCETLGYPMPHNVVLIGIEVFDYQTFSNHLSLIMSRKYPVILQKVTELIHEMIPTE
ncbi:MAG: hydrogenase maturation protease [Bacteroidales bacterium]|nr:hydrogenase maturation protease [Bacteroidales bacterium]